LELFLTKTHFVKGRKQKDFSLTTIIDEDFGEVSSVDVGCDNHGVCVGE
jgi:hypothetical protein